MQPPDLLAVPAAVWRVDLPALAPRYRDAREALNGWCATHRNYWDPARVQQIIEAMGGTVLRKRGAVDLSRKTGIPYLASPAQPVPVRRLADRLAEWAVHRDAYNALKPLVEHCQGRGSDLLAPAYRRATTGRLVLTDPPIHSVPSADRHLISPAAGGRVVVAADWASLELCVAAAMSGETVMLDALHAGVDLLGTVAAQAGVERKAAKAIAYGLSYGAGDALLAAQLGTTLEEAKALRARIEAAWPRWTEWRRALIEEAAKTGVVRTAAGRVIPVVRPDEPDETAKSKAYRAVNYAIQGTGVDLLEHAVELLIADRGRGPELTWHDAIYLVTRQDRSHLAGDALARAMTTAPPWLPSVPLRIEATWGRTLACEAGALSARATTA